MIKYLTFLAGLFLSTSSYSQDILVNEIKNDIPTVSTDDILDRFQTAIQEDYGLIYVDLTLEEVGETKMAGIDTKTALIADLTIRVYSLIDESKIDYKTFKLSGSGRNITKARKSMIRAISRSKRKINTFLASAMKNAQPTNCASLSTIVSNYINTSQYKKAYSIASSRIKGCNDTMWILKQKVYDSYQNEFCERHITKVNAYLSTKDYAKAIREIQNVSVTSKCNNELKGIISIIKNDYQTDYDQSFVSFMKSLELQTLEEKERRRLIDMLLVNNIIDDK
ncbi:MAG: hypothetical protein ACI86M_001510 [Saprospiraceae bacterium]|jgi:hypothetical protein